MYVFQHIFTGLLLRNHLNKHHTVTGLPLGTSAQSRDSDFHLTHMSQLLKPFKECNYLRPLCPSHSLALIPSTSQSPVYPLPQRKTIQQLQKICLYLKLILAPVRQSYLQKFAACRHVSDVFEKETRIQGEFYKMLYFT